MKVIFTTMYKPFNLLPHQQGEQPTVFLNTVLMTNANWKVKSNNKLPDYTNTKKNHAIPKFFHFRSFARLFSLSILVSNSWSYSVAVKSKSTKYFWHIIALKVTLNSQMQLLQCTMCVITGWKIQTRMCVILKCDLLVCHRREKNNTLLGGLTKCGDKEKLLSHIYSRLTV